MVDISTVGTVSVPKRSALEALRRERAEGVSFGIGTLGRREIGIGKPPQGVVIYWYTVRGMYVYGRPPLAKSLKSAGAAPTVVCAPYTKPSMLKLEH